jgi:hypothetical protein
VYYVPRPPSAWDLALMRRIDALHLDFPFAGAQMLRRLLAREGLTVGRRRVGALMQQMGVAAVCQQPGTNRRHRTHPVYPCLLRHRSITTPNEVWATTPDVHTRVSPTVRPTKHTSSHYRSRCGCPPQPDPPRYPLIQACLAVQKSGATSVLHSSVAAPLMYRKRVERKLYPLSRSGGVTRQ